MKQNKIRRVEIDWVDSTWWGGWKNIDEVVAAQKKLDPMKTCGYLISKTKVCAVVATSLHLYTDSADIDRAADFFIIPTVAIKKIKYL